jgi:hypothetical protein
MPGGAQANCGSLANRAVWNSIGQRQPQVVDQGRDFGWSVQAGSQTLLTVASVRGAITRRRDRSPAKFAIGAGPEGLDGDDGAQAIADATQPRHSLRSGPGPSPAAA